MHVLRSPLIFFLLITPLQTHEINNKQQKQTNNYSQKNPPNQFWLWWYWLLNDQNTILLNADEIIEALEAEGLIVARDIVLTCVQLVSAVLVH